LIDERPHRDTGFQPVHEDVQRRAAQFTSSSYDFRGNDRGILDARRDRYDGVMSLKTWWRGVRYTGYDRNGNAKYLAGRLADPSATAVDGVPAAVRDEALTLLCDSFDIPVRQIHHLRRDDELMAIYRSLIGPRSWDQFEFERLALALDNLPGRNFHIADVVRLKTVEDVIHEVASQRGLDLPDRIHGAP
jgi:hypothetical protein